jgi:hypothetical protein
MRHSLHLFTVLASGLVLAALSSCSSGDKGQPGTTGNGSGGSGSGSGGGIGLGDGSVIRTDRDANGIIVSADGAIQGSVGNGSLGDAACASESRTADRVPLDMYLMLDSSLSMSDFIADGVTSKWQAVQKALTAFVNDANSAGLGVGLQYFPLLQPGVPLTCFNNAECKTGGPCNFLKACANATDIVLCQTSLDCGGGPCDPLGACRSNMDLFCAPPRPNVYCDMQRTDPCSPVGLCLTRDICDSSAYATAAVEVAPLPAAAPGIVASLTAHMLDGSTPTGPALSGALAHAKALATANPSHRVIVVLATDGFPTECSPTAIPSIAALATAGAQGTPPIATFVIGVFSPLEQASAQANLDSLAMAGTSGKAFLVNTNQDVTTGFLAALNTIRTTALTCEYGIPSSDAGRLAYNAVNVRFTSGSGQTSTIGYAGSAGACGPGGGWYYDADPFNGGAPTKIEICPATCSSFKADAKGKVDILFGCETIPIVR